MITFSNGGDISGHLVVRSRDETASDCNDNESNGSLVENDSDYESKANNDYDIEKR